VTFILREDSKNKTHGCVAGGGRRDIGTFSTKSGQDGKEKKKRPFWGLEEETNNDHG